MSAAGVVVAVVALVPALGRGSSSTKVQPIGPVPSATRVQQLGIGAGQLSPSSAVSPSPVHANFPGVDPSTIVSTSGAASPLVVESPSPPLSSAPPTPPLITTGACAGLAVAMTFGEPLPSPGEVSTLDLAVSDLAAEPSLNLFTVQAGSTVSFEASGSTACVNRLAVTALQAGFPASAGTAQPNYTFTPIVIRPDAPGVEDIEIMLRSCATANACEGGQPLAEANVSVDPPATSSANPVSSALNVCPTVLPLTPESDAAAQAKAAAVKVVPTIYPPEPTKDFTVTSVYPASSSLNGGSGYGQIAYGTCGKTIGDRTWVVEVHFPHDPEHSASTGNGQLFVSEFRTGWKVWYRYH
jgi:hypothetical protein